MPDQPTTIEAKEQALDQMAEELPLLALPLRTVMTLLYGAIDSLFHGQRFGEGPARPDAGYSIASRLSLITNLLAKCPQAPIGASAYNALSLITPEMGADSEFLFGYAHFCEVMPEVHRKNLSSTFDDGIFTLAHPSDEFRRFEESDIVMAELAVPMFITPPSEDPAMFDGFVAANTFTGEFMDFLVKRTSHYLEHAFEEPVFPEEGFVACLGVEKAVFTRFRAAWVALCDLCNEMAAAEARRGEQGTEELLEWISPLLLQSFVDGLICTVAGISNEQRQACQRFFEIADLASNHPGGDGFLPPVIRLENSYLFSPDVVRIMMASRNIVYGIHKMDPVHFHNVVSSTLEPKLIADAMEIIVTLPGVEVVTNFVWADGEADALAYSEEANTVIHFQAKASIPAQGARMVRSFESRVEEGIEQLERLRNRVDRYEILENAFGKNVEGVHIVEILLCRTSIGTHKVWSELGPVIPVNVPLLRLAVEKLLDEDASFDTLGEVASELLETVVQAAVEGWEYLEIPLIGVSLPLLRLDQTYLGLLRTKLNPLMD